MFFVSKVYSNSKIGITDTDDGKEDIWSNADLVKVITENNIPIGGVVIVNGVAECTPIKMNIQLSRERLVKLFHECRDNDIRSIVPLESYLASARVGTQIAVNYINTLKDGRKVKGEAVFVRLDYDTWTCKDDCNWVSGLCDFKIAVQKLITLVRFNIIENISIL